MSAGSGSNLVVKTADACGRPERCRALSTVQMRELLNRKVRQIRPILSLQDVCLSLAITFNPAGSFQ
jgi:hypothetical protein